MPLSFPCVTDFALHSIPGCLGESIEILNSRACINECAVEVTTVRVRPNTSEESEAFCLFDLCWGGLLSTHGEAETLLSASAPDPQTQWRRTPQRVISRVLAAIERNPPDLKNQLPRHVLSASDTHSWALTLSDALIQRWL